MGTVPGLRRLTGFPTLYSLTRLPGSASYARMTETALTYAGISMPEVTGPESGPLHIVAQVSGKMGWLHCTLCGSYTSETGQHPCSSPFAATSGHP